MNISIMPQLNSNAIIACDVSKDTINLVMRLGKRCIEREIENFTLSLQHELIQLKIFSGLQSGLVCRQLMFRQNRFLKCG